MPDVHEIEIAEDLGPSPQLDWIDKTLFVIDHRYQRSVSERRGQKLIQSIAENFSWLLFQPPTVTRLEDGNYAVIDGQHRVEACKLHQKISTVPCYVVDAAGLKDQARAFVAINRDRVALNPMQMHHASVAGRDPDALHLQAICEATGVVIPRTIMSSLQKKPHHLQAPGAVSTALAEWRRAGDQGPDGDGQGRVRAAALRTDGRGPALRQESEEGDRPRQGNPGAVQPYRQGSRDPGRHVKEDRLCKTEEAILEVLVREYNRGLKAGLPALEGLT